MKRAAFLWGIAAIAACAAGYVPPMAAGTSAALSAGSVIAGYFASWKNLRAKDLPAKQLSHLLYAFGSVSVAGLARLADPCVDAGICADDQAPSGRGGNFSRLALLKRDNPRLRILISLGGWNGSKYFSDAAATTQSRERFAESILDVFFRPYPGLFDGIDIDWEYPVAGGAEGNLHRPQDRENFVALMAEIRRRLAALSAADGRRYELTMAASADPQTAANLDLIGLVGNVDWIGVMTYDYNADATVAGFNAPLFAAGGASSPEANVDASVRYFLRAGVPSGKLVLGIPFYGRAYRDVSSDGNGRAQPGHPAPAWGGADGIDYKDISLRRPESHGFERRWDEKAQVPWLYNPQQRIWISYDDPDSVGRKAAYARSHSLAGVMIWEIGGDDGTLLPAASRGLNGQPNSPSVPP
jgi:chitinase